MLRRHEIEPLLFMMVGFEDETQDSLRALNEWLASTDTYYALSTLLPRVGTPLFDIAVGEAVLARDGWRYLERYDGRLGMSDLPLSEISWFLEFHNKNDRRVSNAVRLQDGSQ
jgi:hypothetical protein